MASDTHLLGIGYRHIRGGENEFGRAADHIRDKAKEATGRVSALDAVGAHLATRFRSWVQPANIAAVALGAVTLAVTVLTGAMVQGARGFVEYERGLIAVGKTADLRGTALSLLGEDIDALSRRLPTATSELLVIAQAAGSLGVTGASNILAFTETLAKLGSASDLAGEEGAAALAAILSVTGETSSTVGTLASVIVSLGNAFAATESQIAHHTGEVARATSTFDVSAAQAAALGTTLASFGVRAELSGSAVGRAFRSIEDAVKGGGSAMRELEAVTGRSAAQFKDAWRRGPIEALDLFLAGLRDVIQRGGNVSAALDRLELSGEEVLKVLPVLAKQLDTLRRAQRLAADEVDNATALENEARAALQGLGAQMDILRNQVSSATRQVGEGMAPAIREVVSDLQTWVEKNRAVMVGVGQLAGQGITKAVAVLKALAASVDLLAAALLGLGAAFLVIRFGPMVAEVVVATRAFLAATASLRLTSVALIGLGGVVEGFKAAWASMTATMAANPIGAIAVTVGLLVTALTLGIMKWREAKRAADEYHAALRSGVPIIDGQVVAHENLAGRLENEIRLRGDLGRQLAAQYRRLEQLEPVLRRMEGAIQSNDDAGYEVAVQQAEALGLALSRAGKNSTLGQVRAEVERLRTALDATRAAQENNAAAIDATQAKVKAGLEEEVALQRRAITERKALVADLRAEIAATQADMERIANSGRTGSGELFTGLAFALANIEKKAKDAAEGLERMQSNIAALRDPAWQRALELFQEGEYDRGGKLAADVGVDPAKIAAATEEWKKFNREQEERKRKEEEARRAAEERERLSKEEANRLREMARRYSALERELTATAAGADRIAQAYDRSTAEGRKMEAQVERDARATQVAAEFEGKYRDEIEKRVKAQVDAERRAQGARTAASLRAQLEAAAEVERALASRLPGAADAARERQELLAAQVAATTGVMEDQVPEIEALATRLFKLEKQNAFETQKLQAEEAASSMAQLNEAWAETNGEGDRATVVIAQATANQEIHNTVVQQTIGLYGTQREEIAKLIREREREAALFEARTRLGRLEEEERRLRELSRLKREDFRTEREYQKALRATNTEHEVRSALITLQFDRAKALAAIKREDFATELAYREALAGTNEQFDSMAQRAEAAIRRQAALQEVIENNERTSRTTTQKWTDFANALEGGLVGVSDQVNELIGGFADLIKGIVAAIEAADKFGRAKGWAEAAGAVHGIAQALGVLDQNTTAGGFGGSGEGNYSAQGSAIGAVVGAIIGAFFSAPEVGLAIGSAAGGVLGSFIKKGADEALGNLRLDSGKVVTQIYKAEGGLGRTLDQLGSRISDALKRIMDSLGASIDQLPAISVKVRDGVISVWVGAVNARVKEMDEAISFAVTEILKQGDVYGLSDTIRTVLKNTVALDLDQLAADLEFGQWYERLGLRDAAVSLLDQIAEFRTKFRQAIELGLDTAPIGEWLGRQLELMRNNLLGIQESPEDALRKNVAAFNSQVKIIEAEQLARRADLLIRRTELEARIRIAEAEITIGRAHLEVREGLVRAEGELVRAEINVLANLQTAIAAVDAALASVDIVLGALPEIISEEEIQRALRGIGGRGAGGGGRGDDQARLRDLLEDSRLARASDYERELAAINKKWDEAIPLAHGNRVLLDEIARARREETEALRQQRVEAGYGRLRDYERGALDDGSPQSQLQGIRDEAQQVRDEFLDMAEELGFGADRIARGIARINAAEQARVRALTEDVIDGLGDPMEAIRDRARDLGQTLSFLRDRVADGTVTTERFAQVFGAMQSQASTELLDLTAQVLERMGADQRAAEIRAQLEEANFLLQVAQLNALFTYYRDLGLLTEEAVAIIEGALDFINDPANRPDFRRETGPPPGGGYGGGDASATAANDDARRREEIRRQIREWNELGRPEVTRELRELNATFVSMRADAGRLGISLSELQAAYGNAVEQFWDEALAPYEEGQGLDVQLSAIHEQFDAMIAAAQQYGGDLDRIEAARREAVRQFWDEVLGPLRDFRDELLGGELNSLSPEQRLQQATTRFNELAERALAGDQEAISQLPSAITALLDVARGFYGTGPAYQALFAQVQAVLDQVLALGGGALQDRPLAPVGDSLYAARSNVLPFPQAPPRASALPVPDDERGGRRDDELAEQVATLADQLERERSERARDRRELSDLRRQVELLLEAVGEQSDQVGDLVSSVRSLSTMVESEQRRRAS